jgi:hypothetical protein
MCRRLAEWLLWSVPCLLPVLAGCGKSAVGTTVESPTQAEAPAPVKPVIRAQAEKEDERAPLPGAPAKGRRAAAAPVPGGERAPVPSGDVNRPLPLPVTAQPVPDRAPLDDATAEAARAAMPSAPLPPRTKPAPFLRLKLPDPFENRVPVRLPTPAEETTPVTASPRPPMP